MSSSQKSSQSPLNFQFLPHSAKLHGNAKIQRQRKNSAAQLIIPRPVENCGSEMCGSLNFWVNVNPQILTKDPLSVHVCKKKEILDPRLSASALKRPALSLICKAGHYVPRPIADYNLPVPVLPCYTRLNTYHFYLFLNWSVLGVDRRSRTTEQKITSGRLPLYLIAFITLFM